MHADFEQLNVSESFTASALMRSMDQPIQIGATASGWVRLIFRPPRSCCGL